MKKLKFVLIIIASILICTVIVNETKIYKPCIYKEVGIIGGTFSGAGFSKEELINVADLVFATKEEMDVVK